MMSDQQEERISAFLTTAGGWHRPIYKWTVLPGGSELIFRMYISEDEFLPDVRGSLIDLDVGWARESFNGGYVITGIRDGAWAEGTKTLRGGMVDMHVVIARV